MSWQPLNLSEVCPPNAQIRDCSNFGIFYLNLLIQLFGDSVDRKINTALNIPQFEDEGYNCYNNDVYGDENKDEEYDFIVVGAGAAGCVVANRLLAIKSWKVLLLEAGPEQPDMTLVPGLGAVLLGSNIDWNYHTTSTGKSCLDKESIGCNWPRGKVMGGSSSINGFIYVRGNKLDYDTWAEHGNVGWSYNDVLPFFKKSERNLDMEAYDRLHHGVKGEQFISRFPYIDEPSVMISEAFNQRGLPTLDFNGASQDGANQGQTISLNGKRVSTNNAFIQPIRWKRRNLIIKTESEAVKVLFDKDKKAYGVVYLHNGKKYRAIARKEVILSGGVINTPKLLMLSGVGPKEHLKEVGIPVVQDLSVGENLHDHVAFGGLVIALSNGTATTVSNEEIIRSVFDYATSTIKGGPLAAVGPLSETAFIRTKPDIPAPDIQYQFFGVQWEEFVRDPIMASKIIIMPASFYNSLTPRIMNLVPKSRGVLLLNATDPYGPPIIFPNYLDDDSDLEPLLEGTRFVMSLENTHAFKSRGAHFVKFLMPACRDYEWGTDEYIICLSRQYTSATHHQVGTCKMGPEWDRNAVVDPTLRVYGVENLRVIDCSVIPVVPRSNINAPTIMVAERGVDFVIKHWLRKTVYPRQRQQVH